MSSPVYADLIGKPFLDYARGPDAYDCYGLVIEVMRRAGRKFPDYGSLSSRASRSIRAAIAAHMREFARVEYPAVLDLVAMWRITPDILDHMGIMVEPGYFLHATAAGVQCTAIDDLNWTGRIVGYYRWMG